MYSILTPIVHNEIPNNVQLTNLLLIRALGEADSPKHIPQMLKNFLFNAMVAISNIKIQN